MLGSWGQVGSGAERASTSTEDGAYVVNAERGGVALIGYAGEVIDWLEAGKDIRIRNNNRVVLKSGVEKGEIAMGDGHDPEGEDFEDQWPTDVWISVESTKAQHRTKESRPTMIDPSGNAAIKLVSAATGFNPGSGFGEIGPALGEIGGGISEMTGQAKERFGKTISHWFRRKHDPDSVAASSSGSFSKPEAKRLGELRWSGDRIAVNFDPAARRIRPAAHDRRQRLGRPHRSGPLVDLPASRRDRIRSVGAGDPS